MELTGIPIRHGMEVEQPGYRVPDEILQDYSGDYFGMWESEYYDQRELPSIGAYKQVKSMVEHFVDGCRAYDDDMPWEWEAETEQGAGCGSHLHLTFEDGEASTERRAKGMAIAWNTCVELAPFLAPFWCFDWQGGFRGKASNWAGSQTTRYSPSTMRSEMRSASRSTSDAVTLNGSTGSKPVTIELRMNENHPAIALVGLTYLRRTMTKAMRKGWSPKLAGDRRRDLRSLYQGLYHVESESRGLVEALQDIGPFRFEEGRGIPGSDQLEYESAWDVLLKVMAVNGVDRGAYDDHVKKLVQAAGDGTEVRVDRATNNRVRPASRTVAADGGAAVYSGSALGPQNNTRAVWHTCDPDFEWDVGPDVESRY